MLCLEHNKSFNLCSIVFLGVVADTNEHSVASARTLALQKADVILLLGARLNWILHFGRPPRYAADVKVIQVNSHYSHNCL